MKGKLEVIFLAILLSFLIIGAFPIVKAKTITVDGDPSDWTGTSPTTNNTWVISEGEYIWRDELDDDTGNGSWVYPTGYIGGEADLLELRITWDEDYLYLLFVFDDIPEGQWNRTAINFVIDVDQVIGSGQAWLGGYADMKVIDEAKHEVDVQIAGNNVAVRNSTGGDPWPVIANTTYPTGSPMLIANSSASDCYEVGIPLAVIGSPAGKTWRFVCIVGVQNQDATWGGDAFAEVFPVGNETNPSGGDDAWEDPDAFDGAFYESKDDQELEFGAFIPGGGENQVVNVSAYADIEMDLIPEFPIVWFVPATIVTATALTIALKKIRKL
jgi:hypothetical protein